MGPGVSPAPKHQINEYESAIVDKLYLVFLKNKDREACEEQGSKYEPTAPSHGCSTTELT
jgi:hypothetical protein